MPARSSSPIPAGAQRLAAPAALAPDQCGSLLGCLAQITDPRHRRSRRHTLGAVLAVAVKVRDEATLRRVADVYAAK